MKDTFHKYLKDKSEIENEGKRLQYQIDDFYKQNNLSDESDVELISDSELDSYVYAYLSMFTEFGEYSDRWLTMPKIKDGAFRIERRDDCDYIQTLVYTANSELDALLTLVQNMDDSLLKSFWRAVVADVFSNCYCSLEDFDDWLYKNYTKDSKRIIVALQSCSRMWKFNMLKIDLGCLNFGEEQIVYALTRTQK